MSYFTMSSASANQTEVSDFKLDRYEDCWPWSIYPSIRDSRGGASPCYKEWRILNGLSIDEPDLETPTREVNPTMPTEYKSLRSSSSATTCKQRPSERAGIMQASSPGPSKHLSKRAAGKQPASSPLGSDPGHALVKSPAPQPDSSGQASSSRQRVQKSRDVTRTQEHMSMNQRQTSNLPPLKGAVTLLEDRSKELELTLTVSLLALQLPASPRHPRLLSLHRQRDLLPLRLLIPRPLPELPHESLLEDDKRPLR